jgi:gas vesicle protein
MARTLKYAGWALAGGAVGALVGLLTAPASGRETRRRIARRVQDEKDAVLSRGHRALEGAQRLVRSRLGEGRRKLAEVVPR